MTKKKKVKFPCWRCGTKHEPIPGATLEFLVTWTTKASLPGGLCLRCCDSFKDWADNEKSKRALRHK